MINHYLKPIEENQVINSFENRISVPHEVNIWRSDDATLKFYAVGKTFLLHDPAEPARTGVTK